jgi:hypothetical protein
MDCPRPNKLSPQIQPMIAVPGHGAWPSGHATETFMVATLLQSLLQHANRTGGKYEEQLQRFAARVAVNRTVAACTTRGQRLRPPAGHGTGRIVRRPLPRRGFQRMGLRRHASSTAATTRRWTSIRGSR